MHSEYIPSSFINRNTNWWIEQHFFKCKVPWVGYSIVSYYVAFTQYYSMIINIGAGINAHWIIFHLYIYAKIASKNKTLQSSTLMVFL